MRNALRSSILLGILLGSVPTHADAQTLYRARSSVAGNESRANSPDASSTSTNGLDGSRPTASHAPKATAPQRPANTASSRNAVSEPPRGASRPGADVPASEAASTSGDLVADLYSKAQNRYLEGDVEAALQFMEQCDELSRRPNLLYNLAQIYRELDRCEPALKNYQQYLKESPNGERREVAEHYVQELGKRCPPKEKEATSGPSSPVKSLAYSPQPVAPASPVLPQTTATGPERARYWTPVRQAGWALSAIGAAAALGSVYFALQAREATRDAEHILRDARENPTPPVWEERDGNARNHDYYYDRKLAIVFGGVSVAALGAGIVALVLAPSAPASRHGHASLTVVPNAVGGGYRWSF